MIATTNGIPQTCPNCGNVDSFDLTLNLDSYCYIHVAEDGSLSLNGLSHLVEDIDRPIVRSNCINCGQQLDLSAELQAQIELLVLDTFPEITP